MHLSSKILELKTFYKIMYIMKFPMFYNFSACRHIPVNSSVPRNTRGDENGLTTEVIAVNARGIKYIVGKAPGNTCPEGL